MSAPRSLAAVREKLLRYLDESFNTTGSTAGWGLRKGSVISVTNTTEALLTYRYLDETGCDFLTQNRPAVVDFLERRLREAIKADQPRIREVAYGALGLELLGHPGMRQAACEKLTALSDSAGWPVVGGETTGSYLVPTYHALSALQALGAVPDNKHYVWLRSLQRSNDRCTFAPGDDRTALAASCLVLFLLASHHTYRDAEWTHRLADAVGTDLDSAFSTMARGVTDWVGVDQHSHFTIFGYGHGLVALGQLDRAIFRLNVAGLVKASDPSGNPADFFSMKPECTEVPAALELAMALHALARNFDPYQYLDAVGGRIAEELASEFTREKDRVARESERLALRGAVFDEREKSLIRERVSVARTIQQLEATIPLGLVTILDKRRSSATRRLVRRGLLAVPWVLAFIPLWVHWLQGKLDFSHLESWLAVVLPMLYATLQAIRQKGGVGDTPNPETPPQPINESCIKNGTKSAKKGEARSE